MIVVCPRCETHFDIPEEKYRPGRKARCSNCGNIFPLPELAAPNRENAEPASFIPPPVSKGERFPPPPEGFETPPERMPEEPGAGDAADAGMDALPPPASVEDAVLDPAREKPVKKSGKKPFFIIAAVVVVLLLGVAGFLLHSVFFSSSPPSSPFERAGSLTSLALGGKGSGEGHEEDAAWQAAVRRLALENVRQYTVADNAKTGRLIVIEGIVVNNFDTPKDLVLLEATIYDQKGNPLILREQYAGVTLSYVQLRTMPRTALENALNNQSDILTNNTNIPPGGRVPFMTVFFDLSNSAYEFEVKIVDVKDPAPAK